MIGLALISMTAVSLAADNVSEVKTFSLEQAVNYALENSPLVGISETGLQKAQVKLKEAKSAYNKSNKSEDTAKAFSVSIETLDTAKLQKGYYKRLAEMGLILAEKAKLQTIESIKFSVESSYFNLLNAQEKLAIQNSILKVSKENLDNIKKKYALGMASQIEVLSFETAYSQAELDKKSAERALIYAKMSFNKTLGLPLDTKVQLTDKLQVQVPPEVDIEKKVEEALENRMEVISATEQYEVDKLNFEITALWYPENTYKYQEAKHIVESSAYSVINSQQTVELSVRKAYMDMIDAYEAIEVLDKLIDQAEKTYETTKVRYDMGMATNNEVVEALNKLQEIKLQKAQALLGYNLAKKQFEASYGIGLTLTP